MNYAQEITGVMVQAKKDYGATSAIEAGKRQPEVFGELDRLAQAVEMLAITSDKLSDRLSSVRRPTGNLAAGGAAGQAPQPVLCGVAGLIRDRRESVERYTQQLQQALAELEI